MYEFDIINKATNEENIIFGYDKKDAFRRYNLNISEWEVWMVTYID